MNPCRIACFFINADGYSGIYITQVLRFFFFSCIFILDVDLLYSARFSPEFEWRRRDVWTFPKFGPKYEIRARVNIAAEPFDVNGSSSSLDVNEMTGIVRYVLMYSRSCSPFDRIYNAFPRRGTHSTFFKLDIDYGAFPRHRGRGANGARLTSSTSAAAAIYEAAAAAAAAFTTDALSRSRPPQTLCRINISARINAAVDVERWRSPAKRKKKKKGLISNIFYLEFINYLDITTNRKSNNFLKISKDLFQVSYRNATRVVRDFAVAEYKNLRVKTLERISRGAPLQRCKFLHHNKIFAFSARPVCIGAGSSKVLASFFRRLRNHSHYFAALMSRTYVQLPRGVSRGRKGGRARQIGLNWERKRRRRHEKYSPGTNRSSPGDGVGDRGKGGGDVSGIIFQNFPAWPPLSGHPRAFTCETLRRRSNQSLYARLSLSRASSRVVVSARRFILRRDTKIKRGMNPYQIYYIQHPKTKFFYIYTKGAEKKTAKRKNVKCEPIIRCKHLQEFSARMFQEFSWKNLKL
ncbi:hypothetical protein PUN28_017484 [Cardiocondyla obscurior]|uniref:Ribosomal protein S3 n=1 Tax=Cardiocondyla obscurior TaxID=286306 RepID=A0AAW2EHI4_9HYME